MAEISHTSQMKIIINNQPTTHKQTINMITPCSMCHKRHGRDKDHGSGSGAGISKQWAVPGRALILITLVIAGSAAGSPESESAPIRKLGVVEGVVQKGGVDPLR